VSRPRPQILDDDPDEDELDRLDEAQAYEDEILCRYGITASDVLLPKD
jgi:hypothetical protein